MTTHDLPSLATLMRSARENKGLTQRELSARVGIPQSHISKIEQGRVDLQTSNLMQIARALDLELALVPRAVLPAVESLSAVQKPNESLKASELPRKLSSLRALARKLRQRFPKVRALNELTDSIERSDWVHGVTDVEQARALLQAVEALKGSLRTFSKTPAQHRTPQRALLMQIENSHRVLRDIRNSVVHGKYPNSAPIKPAYQLDEEDELPEESRDG